MIMENGGWYWFPRPSIRDKDIENIKAGKLVGKNNNQDLMVAGNAIERAHKNISEIANLMLGESHFPYVLFLEGTNFLTETVKITRPDGREVVLEYNSGSLNRLDRLTAANYGLPINKIPIFAKTSLCNIKTKPLCCRLPRFIPKAKENAGRHAECSR